MKLKAFTLIEILITISIIWLVMVGISALTGNQVNRLKEKITREEFVTIYNSVLLNSIGSSNNNVGQEWLQNRLVVYDGVVSTSGFDNNPTDDLAGAPFILYKNGLPWTATLIFDNYSLWCSIDNQTGLQLVHGLQVKLNNEKKPTIGCFMIDLWTCKLLEEECTK